MKLLFLLHRIWYNFILVCLIEFATIPFLTMTHIPHASFNLYFHPWTHFSQLPINIPFPRPFRNIHFVLVAILLGHGEYHISRIIWVEKKFVIFKSIKIYHEFLSMMHQSQQLEDSKLDSSQSLCPTRPQYTGGRACKGAWTLTHFAKRWKKPGELTYCYRS